MGVGKERGGVTPSVPVKANSGVRARIPAAGKVLEGDDKPTLLREDQHYLHYITITEVSNRLFCISNSIFQNCLTFRQDNEHERSA